MKLVEKDTARGAIINLLSFARSAADIVAIGKMALTGYRRAQEEKVCRMAEQKADFVRRTGNRVALAPMSPYFRRIVHLHVANNPDMQEFVTESTGEGDYRQIVLRLKDGVEKKSDGDELSPVIDKEEDGGLDNLDI